MVELKMNDESAVPGALRDWSAKLDITHFEVIVPSLHNIFVQTVLAAGGELNLEGGAA